MQHQVPFSRSLGEAAIKERIENIFEMLEVLNNKLSEFTCLRVLSQRQASLLYLM